MMESWECMAPDTGLGVEVFGFSFQVLGVRVQVVWFGVGFRVQV
jgi:hypothetical protein